MGQKHSSSTTIRDSMRIDPQQWQQIRYAPDRKIVQNLRTNIEAQCVVIQLQPHRKIQKQLQIYLYRKEQENALVKVYAAEQIKDSHAPLCGNIEMIKVIHQRILRRLNEVPLLSFPQALLFLVQACRGFKDCYQKVGFFEICQQMIGVNTQGEVRVWVNEDFAFNHPQVQRPTLQITSAYAYTTAKGIQEKAMLDNLLRVIQNHTQRGQFFADFKERIYNEDTFADAYCEIETYSTEKNIWVPDRLPSNSLVMQNQEPFSKIAQFKSYARENRTQSSQAYNSEPHATYIPNTLYSYPRMTYIEGLNSKKISQSLADKVGPSQIVGGAGEVQMRQAWSDMQKKKSAEESPQLKYRNTVYTYSNKKEADSRKKVVSPKGISLQNGQNFHILKNKLTSYHQ